MNAKKAKRLRKTAREMCEGLQEVPTHTQEFKAVRHGEAVIAITRVNEDHFRGIYLALKALHE